MTGMLLDPFVCLVVIFSSSVFCTYYIATQTVSSETVNLMLILTLELFILIFLAFLPTTYSCIRYGLRETSLCNC